MDSSPLCDPDYGTDGRKQVGVHLRPAAWVRPEVSRAQKMKLNSSSFVRAPEFSLSVIPLLGGNPE